ncbi:MAG: 23S rRNA (pseudouridine(1915)-N(3))-methyltransferase RlmH [Pseudomonadota bacterium]
MRLTICAVGRMKRGPELELVEDYTRRLARLGGQIGLSAIRVSEVEAKRGGGSAEEARLLERAQPDGARLVCLDERGKAMSSPDFAKLLATWRDDGVQDAAFAIGGADGLTPELRARADLLLSFGPMVWPHMLVRAMLVEQLYRAASILAGTPYHRD